MRRTHYRAKIKKLYGTMQIMGMAEPVPLDDIFTDAYLLDKPTAFGRVRHRTLETDASADPDAPPPARKRINGLRLVKRKKATSSSWASRARAKQPSLNTSLSKLPSRTSLSLIKSRSLFPSKQWADSDLELLPFVAERFDICEFPAAQPFVEELLKSGTAIVLFDGLDEVNQESGQRDKQTRAMNNFVEKYDRTQCLITCRIAASDYSFQALHLRGDCRLHGETD